MSSQPHLDLGIDPNEQLWLDLTDSDSATPPPNLTGKDLMGSQFKPPYYVLGLDPGIASCGFCLIDIANHRIVEMGSHLFAAPQHPKTKTSLATERRAARSIRRNTKRTRDRLTHVLKLLKCECLVPPDAQKQWFQPRKGEKPVLELRALGLDRKLNDREWAQVLYSLCVRRGYIPHGEGNLDTVEKSSDDRKVLAAIKANTEKLREGGFRTVGEMLASTGISRNKGGKYDLCITNAQIVDEVKALFAAQESFDNSHAGRQFLNDYLACLTWQKETDAYDERIYSTVGSCSYFPELKRAASADVTSELLRAHERLAHIRLVAPDGTECSLPYWARQQFIAVLFSPVPLPKNKECKVRYSDIRKVLDWSGRGSIKGINEADEKTKEVFVPKAWRSYRSNGVPVELLKRMLEDLDLGDAIGEALTYASSEKSLVDRLGALNLTKDEIDALTKVPFGSKVFKGYDSRSLKAQRMLLEAFEDDSIATLYEAEEAVGLAQLRRAETTERAKLLKPFSAYDPTCRNPVVLRALGRMRRIVNAIIRIYGVPNEIHVELGRELKLSKKEQSRIEKINNENEKRRRRISGRIAEIMGITPEEVKGSAIRKYELWEEQGNFDIYTGDHIDEERMVRDSTYCQIDHILPYSKTCDDSRANKVLVLAKSNQDKKERSPYSWMHSGEDTAPDWDEFCARIQASRLPYKKKEHLLERDLAGREKAFIERNLNDDRYMSVAVKDYLEKCLDFPESNGKRRHVYAVAGGATANLRRTWHLNFGENDDKDRLDDRHHAVDAAVIAACSASIVKGLADASARKHTVPKEERSKLFEAVEPWPGFADDVRAARDIIVPTRMADHGVTGKAFEETLYRLDGTDKKGKGILWLKKGSKASGNYVVDNTGKARILGELAFLRLWFDPAARPKGKVKGQWYGEPVYYADMPAIIAGTYTPRYMTSHSARNIWPVVPESALANHPMVLFPGDVVQVNDKIIGRFKTVNIDAAAWKISPLEPSEDNSQSRPPTIGSLGKDDKISVIEEDVLGRCYYRL